MSSGADGVQVGIAMRAAGRLSAKLEAARGCGRAVDMEEEFRLLTLQVIGEAVLSLPPEECDRVWFIPPSGCNTVLAAGRVGRPCWCLFVEDCSGGAAHAEVVGEEVGLLPEERDLVHRTVPTLLQTCPRWTLL